MERSEGSHKRKIMLKEELKITCPIFQNQETVIKDIIDKINMAKGIREKAIFAEELQKEADVFLTCSDYDDKKLDCKNCRFIANFRKKTAGLIIRVFSQLSG